MPQADEMWKLVKLTQKFFDGTSKRFAGAEGLLVNSL